MRLHGIAAAACAAAVLGCSASAQSPAQASAPGALRARAADGTDLGLVYHLERMGVVPAPGGASSVPVAVLKAPGAPAFLEWRTVRSGEAYPCPSVHELPGCAGAGAMADLAMGFACAGADGHAYLLDVHATPADLPFQSRRDVTFDGAAFVVTCTDVAGSLARALPLLDAGVSRTIASRLTLEPAD